MHQNQFVSAWLGGAVGTFLGFGVGIWWHFKEATRRSKTPYFTIFFIGSAAVMFGVVAVMVVSGYLQF